jgi:hypothetical protein
MAGQRQPVDQYSFFTELLLVAAWQTPQYAALSGELFTGRYAFDVLRHHDMDTPRIYTKVNLVPAKPEP